MLLVLLGIGLGLGLGLGSDKRVMVSNCPSG